jgi:hypothetical protein
MTSYETPNLNAALPSGVVSRAVTLRAPRDRMNLSVQFDDAITRDQTLRVGFYRNDNTADNLGVGGFGLPERAYSTIDSSTTFRIQEAGPLGRRFFMNTRLNVNRLHNEQHAALEAPTIRVADAFTSGGAQTAGGRDSTVFNLASDLDYVRGIHSLRTGIVLEVAQVTSTLASNYLRTFTFEAWEAFDAKVARIYEAHGDPTIEHGNVQGAVYMQDDIRVRRGLTLSPGVRYESQKHVKDRANVGPRFAVTWAPFKSGTTTLPASTGMLYDWLDQFTYEQTLRVDGFRQREVDIFNPAYPDPGDSGVVAAVSKYLLSPDWQMPKNLRFTGAVDKAITPTLRLGVVYNTCAARTSAAGLNLNAPVDGVRPDPTFSNIIEAVSDASAPAHDWFQLSDRRAAAARASVERAEGRLEACLFHRPVHLRRLEQQL